MTMERRQSILDWLANKKCPNCGVKGALVSEVVRLDKLNEYRCTSCGTNGLTVVDMSGPVSHPVEGGCCWAGTGCCGNMP